jgi:hypothetical protein
VFIVLAIFRYVALILFTNNRKKTGIRSKNINYLLVLGIILLAYSVISFFFPGVSLYYPYSESEDFLFHTIVFLYDSFPNIIEILLGVVLLFYISSYQRTKKSLLGPILFLVGYTTFLIFILGTDFLWAIDSSILSVIYNLYLVGYLVTLFIPVIGFFFIFLYSIHHNNAFFIMFCALFFASLLGLFVYRLNFISYYFRYYW